MFKKGYIEVCLTTEDGIQHLRLHGWLKREKILIKTEQIFNSKKTEDFGMFIIVIPHEQLYEIIELKDDMFTSFEVIQDEKERWNTYKTTSSRNFMDNISAFMFSLVPQNKIDIEEFTNKANEATLNLFKTSDNFRADYVLKDFMTTEEKLTDLDYLIDYFENQERYEDCGYLLKIKDKIIANEEFKSK